MARVSVAQTIWDALVEEAAAESSLWAGCLRPAEAQRREPVFSLLVPAGGPRLGVETIYEGYLVHYGNPRLFAPPDADTAILLGDYLYAHGLVRVAATGDVAAVRDLAELISLCAQARADGRAGADGAVWAATAALLGRGGLDGPRRALREQGDAGPLTAAAVSAASPEAVETALVTHARLVR
jgi:hypothetical protein